MLRDSAKRMAQSDVAFKLAVVVVRRVGAGGGREAHGGIQHEVVRRCSPVDGGGVHVGFEGGARLPQSLGRAIELGVVEVASADHGADFTAGIVERQQRSLYPGVLLQRKLSAGAIHRHDASINHVADAQDVGDGFASGPLDSGDIDEAGDPSQAHRRRSGRHFGDQAVKIRARLDQLSPVRVVVSLQVAAGGDNIGQIPTQP